MSSNEKPLAGKVAAITGASSGIGQSIAETLGAAGAHVFISGRKASALEEVKSNVEKSGGKATTAIFEMRDETAVRKFVQDAAAATGHLDIMVNNAGLGHNKPIVDGVPEEWREMLEVNVLGLLIGCQEAVKVMRAGGKPGRIINISSTAAKRRDSGVYGATKHAVNVINWTLRDELQDDPIRVTSIMPGPFASNFIRNYDRAFVEGLATSLGITDLAFDEEGRLPRETLAEVQKKLEPVLGNTEEIAKAVLYVVQQPPTIGLDEIVIRPQKTIDF